MAFSFWLAWNVTTRRALIGISSPVLGLRPGRCGLMRSWKLPKPESLTLRPSSRAVLISSKKRSTMSLASRLLRPSCSKRRSASSALVSVMGTHLSQRGAEPFFQSGDEPGDDPLAVGVGQSTLSITHKHQNRNAFPTGTDFRPAIDVKDFDRLDLDRRGLPQRFKYIAYSYVFVAYNCDVPPHRRHPRHCTADWNRDRLERRGIELEDHRRARQFERLQEARVELAQPADDDAVDAKLRSE